MLEKNSQTLSFKYLIGVSSFMLLWNSVAVGATALDSLLPRSLPQGWVLTEGPRSYNPRTLFERINGQAELYIKYGFQRSVFAAYQELKRPENQIELDLYDMGNVLQAFGVFSRFRTEDRPGGVGLDSDLGDSSLLFYKGRYFVMLYATEPDPQVIKEFGRAVSAKINDPSGPPREIGYFPTLSLKPGSIQYFSESLLGLGFLKRGFQAAYREDTEVKAEVERKTNDKGKTKAENKDKESHLFMAMFEDGEGARRALKTYRDYLTNKGKLDSKTPQGLGPQALSGEDPYKGKVLAVQRDSYLVGIAGFEKEDDAANRLLEFIKKMR
jgi:hypothetical protein